MFYHLEMKHKEQVTKDTTFRRYNVRIDGQNFFDQPIRNNLITNDNIQKIAKGQGDITQLIVC